MQVGLNKHSLPARPIVFLMMQYTEMAPPQKSEQSCKIIQLVKALVLISTGPRLLTLQLGQKLTLTYAQWWDSPSPSFPTIPSPFHVSNNNKQNTHNMGF